MYSKFFLFFACMVSQAWYTVHYREADVTAYDCSDMNPFMVAIEKNHLEVAKMILEKNPDCLGSQSAAKITDWALEKDLTSFFQVCP